MSWCDIKYGKHIVISILGLCTGHEPIVPVLAWPVFADNKAVTQEDSISMFYVICSLSWTGTTFTCKKTRVRNKHLRLIMGIYSKIP